MRKMQLANEEDYNSRTNDNCLKPRLDQNQQSIQLVDYRSELPAQNIGTSKQKIGNCNDHSEVTGLRKLSFSYSQLALAIITLLSLFSVAMLIALLATINNLGCNVANVPGNQTCDFLPMPGTTNRQTETQTALQICNEPRFVRYGNKCYYFSSRFSNLTLPWNDANVFCVLLGGHLVTIDDADENKKVKDWAIQFHSGDSWIGLRVHSLINNNITRCKDNSIWKWVGNNQTATYTNWSTGEPSSCHGNEKCAELFVGGSQWNDVSCIASRYYICQSL